MCSPAALKPSVWFFPPNSQPVKQLFEGLSTWPCEQVMFSCTLALAGWSITGQVFANPCSAQPAHRHTSLCTCRSCALSYSSSSFVFLPICDPPLQFLLPIWGGAALYQGKIINVTSEKLILSLFEPMFCFGGFICCSFTWLAELLRCSVSTWRWCK